MISELSQGSLRVELLQTKHSQPVTSTEAAAAAAAAGRVALRRNLEPMTLQSSKSIHATWLGALQSSRGGAKEEYATSLQLKLRTRIEKKLKVEPKSMPFSAPTKLAPLDVQKPIEDRIFYPVLKTNTESVASFHRKKNDLSKLR